MKIIIAILISLITSTAFAQQMMITESVGNIAVKKDSRLDVLSAKQAEINKKAVFLNTTHANGFRILVINSSNRDEANTIKDEMLRRFPEQKTYLLY